MAAGNFRKLRPVRTMAITKDFAFQYEIHITIGRVTGKGKRFQETYQSDKQQDMKPWPICYSRRLCVKQGSISEEKARLGAHHEENSSFK